MIHAFSGFGYTLVGLVFLALPVELVATRRAPGWNPWTSLALLTPHALCSFWLMLIGSSSVDYSQCLAYHSMAAVVHFFAGVVLLVTIPMGAALFWKNRAKCGTILTTLRFVPLCGGACLFCYGLFRVQKICSELGVAL